MIAIPFKQFYKKYKKVAFDCCLNIVDHTGEAEDIVADAFVGVYKKWDSFDLIEEAGAYLFTACKNKCRNILKHKKRAKRSHSEIAHLSTDRDDFSEYFYSRVMHAEFKLKRIKELVVLLPDAQKKIFNMRWFEEMTTSEISKELSIAIDTVRVHLKRAIDFIKENWNIKIQDIIYEEKWLIHFNGKTLEVSQWCEQLNLNYHSVMKKVYNGAKPAEALMIKSFGIKRNSKFTYNGKSLTVKQWAKEGNISYNTVMNRIHTLKWTIAEALELQPAPQKTWGQVYTFNGKSLTLKEWSKELKTSVNTLQSRLCSLGWPIEKVLSTS